MHHYTPFHLLPPQEVGGTLIGEDGLVVMAGVDYVEWFKIHQSHGFQVIDAILFAPLQPLLLAVLPSEAH